MTKITNGDNEENEREYYLVKVPKSIDINKLNGLKIDLQANKPTKIESAHSDDEEEEDVGYGYHVLPTNLNNVTRLVTTDPDNIEIDPHFVLRGCISVYKQLESHATESILVPLVPECPNDSIENIVNQARGFSVPKPKAKRSAMSDSVMIKSEKKKHKNKH